MSIYASSGESCTGSLGDSVACIFAPPEIGGSNLCDEKDTAYLFRDCEEEPNEEEGPRKLVQSEIITKSSDPPGIVSIFKTLPQTDKQCSKVNVKHGQCLWCAICDIHVNNRGDRDFTIGRWREHKKNVGHKKALANNIAASDLKKREKASYIINEREKKHINFRKKSNT